MSEREFVVIQPGELQAVTVGFGATTDRPGLAEGETMTVLELVVTDAAGEDVTDELVESYAAFDQVLQVWVHGVTEKTRHTLSILVQGSLGEGQKIRKYLDLICRKL
jgi:hypothetical protein